MTPSPFLTRGHEAPHDRRRSEAGEDVVRVAEVCEVRQDNGLAPALTPHINLEVEGSDPVLFFFLVYIKDMFTCHSRRSTK